MCIRDRESSKFITTKKSDALIEKIHTMTSPGQVAKFKRCLLFTSRCVEETGIMILESVPWPTERLLVPDMPSAISFYSARWESRADVYKRQSQRQVGKCHFAGNNDIYELLLCLSLIHI